MGDLSSDTEVMVNGDHGKFNGLGSDDQEPIAIIGIGCRYPGGASTPQKLWDLLASGKSAWSKGPENRFNMEAFHDADNRHPSVTNTNGGHFLSQDIAAFDAPFFSINALEAKAMDPQQRVLLEVAYETFENAGVTADQLSDSNTGVYVGQWTADYAEVLARDTEFPATYHTIGVGPAITSNRISYQFNLKGPSLTVDTGCSSSLVALHMAVQSLRAHETEAAFVAGVNLLVDPQRFTYQSKLKMFSKDGRSFAFDERANGYGRGEGCGCVLLKPLSKAQRDGDNIRAVIRNSVLNQDGRTPGISVPSGEAQEKAIRKAYMDQGIPFDVDYVEAHGTGTAVGDPIEVGAIAAVLSKHRDAATGKRLPIGSIKGNIGHTESAAGIAGLIKAVLMLEKGAIPPQVNFEKPNGKILVDEWKLRIPVALESCELNRISVNSFGYGGTNAHVIIEKTKSLTLPQQRQIRSTNSDGPSRVFIISGGSEKSCQKFASNLAEFVAETARAATSPDGEWMDRLAYTLNRRRIHQHRAIIAAATPEALEEKLKTISTKPEPVAPGPDDEPTRVAYVFSGQGAQYYNMGRELIHVWPRFTESLSRFNRSIGRLGCAWDVFVELHRDAAESRLDEPRYGQPLSTAIQMALVDTLASLNIKPHAVAGHSSGEIAAAYAAGYLSFDDAVLASYHRGRLTSDLLERETDLQGAMLAVGAASGVVEEYMARLGDDSDRVVIACYNSPASVTVSGDLPVIQQLSELLEKSSVFNRIVRTKGAAYHSDQMRLIEDEYREALQQLQVLDTPTSVTMVSSSTGSPIEDAQELGPDYWVNNLVSPVYFEDAVWGLLQAEDGAAATDVVVELGAHSQLEGPVKQTIQAVKGEGIRYLSTLKRKSNAAEALLVCLGHLFSQGIKLDLHHANCGFQKELPSLLASAPSYAFDHGNTYWHEGRVSKAYTRRQLLPHELIGNLAIDANSLEPRWRRFLNLKELPWLQSHIVQDQCVFPAAGYLAMAIEGMRRHKLASESAGDEEILGYDLQSISIAKALIIDQDSVDHEICLSMRPEPRSARNSSGRWMEFRIFSVSSTQEWTEHCRGLISVTTAGSANPQAGSSLKQKDLTDPRAFQSDVRPAVRGSLESAGPDKFYFLSRDAGLDWTAPFNNLVSIKLGSDTSVCTVQCPDVSVNDIRGGAKYIMHPATLDAALFHGLCSVLLLKDGLKSPAVPTFIQHLFISAKFSEAQGLHLNCYSTRKHGPMTFDVDVSVGSADSEQVVVRAEGVTATPLPGDVALHGSRDLVHSLRWVTYTGDLGTAYVDARYKSAIAAKSVAEHNRNLEAKVLSYVQEALKTTTVDQVPDDYRRRWFAWMQSKAADDGSVDASKLTRHDFDHDLDGEYEAVTTLGTNLTGLLTGKVDPLDLLMKSGLVSSLYSNERCQRCYQQMAAYCRDLVAEKPGMRVLEIGAGTGSASEVMLQALCPKDSGNSSISRYEFTDISSGFFEAAKTRLPSEFSSVVNYRTLDIEKDIAVQGLEEGSFDLVIACNVIHATSSIGRSLDHARALLRPGGTLLLMEITKDALYYNMTFGSLPGWWAGDEEGRVKSPLISEPEWEAMLTAHKFNKPMATFRDYEATMGGTVSVFVATAVPVDPEPMTHLIEVVHDRSKPSQIPGLADALRSSLGVENVSCKGLVEVGCASYSVSVFLPEVCESLIDDITPEEWNSFKNRLLASKAVLFLTRGASRDSKRPRGAMLAGLARSFRLEHQDIRVINLDFDLETSAQTCCEVVAKVLQGPSFDGKMADDAVEHEFAECRGQLYVPRVVHQKDIEDGVLAQRNMCKPEMRPFLDDSGRTLMAEAEIPGLLDTLRWRDDPDAAGPLGPDEIQMELRAASINFKDVLIASGQLEGVTEMKNDCSGVVTEVGANMRGRFKRGDRVCAYYSRSYTNRPRVHGDACALIPDHLSFAEAASLPIVWGTVYYSLVDQARLQRGESVLIHSAAGAVGQAAIILSQHLQAEVFVTVSSNEKRDFLMKTYGIPEDHIFSSRTTAFGRSIRAMTRNEGVDVVLNSLGGDIFRESCNTVAPYGRFVEIGRKEFLDDMLMPARFLLKNITFSYVDLALLIDDKKPLVRRVLEDVMDLMSRQVVRPTSIMTMPISEIEAAFRLIQAGKHMGKVILTVSDGQLAKMTPPAPASAQLNPDGAYLVIGGLGGLGKAILRWMGSRGARRIVTASRSGACDDEAAALISDLGRQGVSVEIERCDITQLDQVEVLINRVQQGKNGAPICGVIQSAMVVQDTVFSTMEYRQWRAAHLPKTAGTWNLYQAVPRTIDFFLIMSSAVDITGNAGQSNYAAACAYQDALAHHMRANGVPAYSVNVGAVADSGFVAEHPEVASALRRKGFGTIETADLLATLNHVLRDASQYTVDSCQCALGLVPKGNEPGLRTGVWATDSKLRHLYRREGGGSRDTCGGDSGGDVGEMISSAKTVESALHNTNQAIIRQLSKLIGIAVDYISDARSLDDYGVDSLVAVELRNWIGAFLQANIPILVLRKTKSIKELAHLVVKESRLVLVKAD